MIIFGTRIYGKMDHVPGLFYIGTSFVHINFVPLIPLGSYLIIDDGSGENGISCPFHLTSLLMAWVRPAGVLVALWAAGYAIFSSTLVLEARIGFVVLACVAVAMVYLSYWIIQCGRARAVRLAERAGLDANLVHDHFDHMEGKPVADRPRTGPLDNEQLGDALRRWNPK
jgi:hypothetical protein